MLHNFPLDDLQKNSMNGEDNRKDNKARRKIHKRLDLKANNPTSDNNVVFGSHSFHEVTMA